MKRLTVLLVLLCSFSWISSAQSSKQRIELSTSFLYSLNEGKTSPEISLAYKFDRAVVKANFDCFDLIGADDVYGESVSVIYPSNKPSTDFTLCPEIGVGIAHGKFSGESDTSVKSQFFLGTVLEHSLSGGVDCGLLMRYCMMKDNSIFLIGYKIGVRF